MRFMRNIFKKIILLFLPIFLLSPISDAFNLDIAPDEVIPGDVIALTIPYNGSSSVKGTFRGTDISFYPADNGRLIALLPVDINTKAGNHKITIEQEDQSKEYPINVRSHKFKTVKLSLPKKKVTLSKEDGERAVREANLLKKIWSRKNGRLWEGRFIPPTDTELSQVFGVKRIMNEVKTSIHKGTDYRGKKGTPVKSINSGTVVLTDDLFFGGNTVVVDHGMGLYSIYMHLSKFEVSKGDSVNKGQLIGLIGSTGRATGPHLHMSVKLNGISINPESLFKLKL